MNDSATQAGVGSAASGSGSSDLLSVSLYPISPPQCRQLIQSAVGFAAESSHRVLAASHDYLDVKGKP